MGADHQGFGRAGRLTLGLRTKQLARVFFRHPEVAAKRPSKADGPGLASFEARFARAAGCRITFCSARLTEERKPAEKRYLVARPFGRGRG